MGEIQFFQTPMGRTYYEYTLPELVKAINRLVKVLEEMNQKLEKP